jgi:hypothetical protein
MQHNTKHIEYTDADNFKFEADVDELIAPLVLNLWKLGIKTNLSCQNNKGKVWIDFFSAVDAEEFLNYVAEFDRSEESMYQRMGGTVFGGGNNDQWYDWQYDIHCEDYAVSYPNMDEEPDADDLVMEFDGEHAFIFSVSVRFPTEDLTRVMERIEKAVEGQTKKQKRMN